jgi:hypothetical protein
MGLPEFKVYEGASSSKPVSQNQPVALLEFAVHLNVYGKVYSRRSAIVAYTNNGYLRDAQRCL